MSRILPLLLLITISACHSRKGNNGDLSITNAWLRPAPKGGMSALYFTITNNRSTADTLLAIDLPISSNVEFHETRTQNGVSGMYPLGTRIPIPPHTRLVFKPGGKHVMIMGLQKALASGDTLSATFHFAQVGERTLKIPVR